jgi:hypothetical protein
MKLPFPGTEQNQRIRREDRIVENATPRVPKYTIRLDDYNTLGKPKKVDHSAEAKRVAYKAGTPKEKLNTSFNRSNLLLKGGALQRKQQKIMLPMTEP